MPIYIYKGNSQISTNAVRNDRAVKAIYAKEQGKDAVCVWGGGVNLLPFTYTKDATSVTITGLRTGLTWEHLAIPERVENLPVTQITSNAFKDSTTLQSIELPNSLISIGNDAFNGCTGLTSITIPDSVTSIGNHAFERCESLKSIKIPNGVTSISIGAFGSCKSLESVTIPNSVMRIGDYSYFCCKSLENITIPDSVTRIGNGAFLCCESLQSITIPNNVTSIGKDVFNNCNNLTICAPSGSYAIEYAKDNGIKFKEI